MGKILALDHGTKRIGVAICDELRIIASGLETIAANDIIVYLRTMFEKEQIDEVVVGLPVRLNLQESAATQRVREFIRHLEKKFPERKFVTYDERFTSKIAERSMIEAGAKKKQRAKKETIDMISATILLQDYMSFLSRGV